MCPPKRVKNDKRLSGYKVIDFNKSTKKHRKHKMKDYFAGESTYYPVPGLVNTNILGKDCTAMVPQGICKMDEYLLITAYDSEGKHNSVIYVLDERNSLKATLIYDKMCHMGGITYDGKYVWIAEGSKSGLGVIRKEELLASIRVSEENNAKSILLTNIMWLNISEITSTSYCTYYDNTLWVGMFHKKEDSQIYGYRVDDSKDVPQLIKESHIQVPKQAQGMCFYQHEGVLHLAIATSYGRHYNSIIWCYKISKDSEELLLSDGKEYKTLTMPPMLEQISMDGSKMYGIFESGARKYLMNMDGYGYSKKPIGSYVVFAADKVFEE